MTKVALNRDNAQKLNFGGGNLWQYKANPDYRLIYAVFGFVFANTTISFVQESIHTFSPQFLPI